MLCWLTLSSPVLDMFYIHMSCFFRCISFYIFIYVSSLNFHKSYTRIYKRGFWGSERLRNCRGQNLGEVSRGHSDLSSLTWRWWGSKCIPPTPENSSCQHCWEGHLRWLRWLCSLSRSVGSRTHHHHSPGSPQQPPNWSRGTRGLPHLQSDLRRGLSKIHFPVNSQPPHPTLLLLLSQDKIPTRHGLACFFFQLLFAHYSLLVDLQTLHAKFSPWCLLSPPSWHLPAHIHQVLLLPSWEDLF